MVLIRIKKEHIERETTADQEDGGKTGHHTSVRRGLPCAPVEASTKFTTQCEVVVRARVPITTRLWKTKNPDEERYTVPSHQKEMLWRELKNMFTLAEGVDEEHVKKCALKKMAIAFGTFKKKLFGNYVKKDKEPNWDSFPQVKPYWEEFKEYKMFEEAREASGKNTINAALKKHNHHLRLGGYKKTI
ncbi:hypothetical protein C2845_PM15G02740 [Panicum miliaceum]|uniref:Uncharacterized protein n=1 Tax=Panicum miliaceum TaxID=4540 RepID=A0A3L6Q9N5_PANMI|nr:hypothetical protein C2845_PM15G02740 [Panicum miliaceum]